MEKHYSLEIFDLCVVTLWFCSGIINNNAKEKVILIHFIVILIHLFY